MFTEIHHILVSIKKMLYLGSALSLYVRAHLMCYAAIIWSSINHFGLEKFHSCGIFEMLMINDCLNVFWCVFSDLEHSVRHQLSIHSFHRYRNIMETSTHLRSKHIPVVIVLCLSTCLIVWFNPAGGESHT